jgi:WD40 repeat protein
MSNGQIHLMNLLYDEVLFTFQQADGGANFITFLTDTTLGQSLMATASNRHSSIALWDLNAKKIWAEMKHPHSAHGISSLAFIPNEPVLLSASEDDNSIKMWFLEKGQSLPRLLRERCGHAEAPHKLRFYGGLDDPANQGARNLVTCSKDGNLRDISLLNEFQSMNFSKKK